MLHVFDQYDICAVTNVTAYAAFGVFGNATALVGSGLAVTVMLLLAAAYVIRRHTVRIYNWNGRRFCYLGRAPLHRSHAGYWVSLNEHMADMSYTTRYRVCPSRSFVRRHRYKDMLLCAGVEKCMLTVDECMERSVYYRAKR